MVVVGLEDGRKLAEKNGLRKYLIDHEIPQTLRGYIYSWIGEVQSGVMLPLLYLRKFGERSRASIPEFDRLVEGAVGYESDRIKELIKVATHQPDSVATHQPR